MSASVLREFPSRPSSAPTYKPVAAPAASSPSLVRGLVAGLIGGLIGTAAKSMAESMYPPRAEGQPEPPSGLAEKAAGRPLAVAQNKAAVKAIHWSFGPVVGAAYGVLAEFAPVVTDREGVTFGVALCTLTHEGVLPALGAASSSAHQPLREQSSEMISHTVYGFVTEIVRKQVRRML